MLLLVVTETRNKPDNRIPLKWRSESVCNTKEYRGKASVGVTIHMQGTPRHNAVTRELSEKAQVIAVKCRGIIVVGVYMSPARTPEETTELLMKIKGTCRG